MPYEYEYKGQIIESDRELTPDEIKKAFNYVDSSSAPTSANKGFLDRLGESSNLMKALSSPGETLKTLAKESMPRNVLEAAYAPMLVPARMMAEGIKSYSEDVADREARLFERMNEDPDNASLRAAQMLVAPVPFAGKLVEPLEEDIMHDNSAGVLGSAGGVALDALAGTVAPHAMRVPGAVGSATRSAVKPLGQKIYSNAVAREAARKSVPHIPNPMPYIRNPYNPIMLAQDIARTGQNFARSSRVEALQKALGEKLNPEVRGLGKNKPGFSGQFDETRSVDDIIDAEDSAAYRRENELDRIMNQERLNYSPRDFENRPGDVMPIEAYDPRMYGGQRIPKFIEPESAPVRGVSALRGKLSQLDPHGINPNALEPSIPRSVEDLWAEQLIEEEAGGKPALAPVDSVSKEGYASIHPKGSQDFTSEQILAEQNRIKKMLEPDEAPVIENPPDVPSFVSDIDRKLAEKGIPEEKIASMAEEQKLAALQRKGTRASGTNPRAMRGEGSRPKVSNQM